MDYTPIVVAIIGAGALIGGPILLLQWRIWVQGKSTHVLVNSRYSAMLVELARVKTLLAKQTGLKIDEENAEQAQVASDEQALKVYELGKEKK